MRVNRGRTDEEDGWLLTCFNIQRASQCICFDFGAATTTLFHANKDHFSSSPPTSSNSKCHLSKFFALVLSFLRASVCLSEEPRTINQKNKNKSNSRHTAQDENTTQWQELLCQDSTKASYKDDLVGNYSLSVAPRQKMCCVCCLERGQLASLASLATPATLEELLDMCL